MNMLENYLLIHFSLLSAVVNAAEASGYQITRTRYARQVNDDTSLVVGNSKCYLLMIS